MKAIFVTSHGGPEVLELREVPDPIPGPSQVVIKASASSINAADIKAREGSYHLGAKPPFVPGLDTYGTVVAIGEDVTNVSVGDNVVAFTQTGSYAEYVVARDVHSIKVQASIDPIKAASIPIAAFTAYNIIADIGRMGPGESVLIHGASGGVGVFCSQIAKKAGAKTVIGTTTSKDKIPALQSLGYDFVVDTSEHDFAQVVSDITNGQGVNVVIDSFGGDILSKSLRCTNRYGRVISIGITHGNPSQLDIGNVYADCKSLIGYSFGTIRKHNPERIIHTANQVLSWVSANELQVPVYKTFPFGEAAAAHAVFESHKHVGKIVLTIDC
ncbi:quinone oxidoreductase family protein [Alicyclobacillus fastidiosus]|uniref:quinone oxidoreductase family protein n=1 Tax=Alicyclobacillus fastidiosus TaxID=392011 RepID=UPI0023EA0F8C|nr:zinc-binding dehydrogenase [Alicyclobacillus fastidiosus]GMA66146.1 quinone oxidoreductase [Alicyclobacillus fastidiosus]